jgi:hypothetical protein
LPSYTDYTKYSVRLSCDESSRFLASGFSDARVAPVLPMVSTETVVALLIANTKLRVVSKEGDCQEIPAEDVRAAGRNDENALTSREYGSLLPVAPGQASDLAQGHVAATSQPADAFPQNGHRASNTSSLSCGMHNDAIP